jgi:hypothetical protein
MADGTAADGYKFERHVTKAWPPREMSEKGMGVSFDERETIPGRCTKCSERVGCWDLT